MKAVFIFHHLIFPSQKLLQFTVGIHFRFFIVATSHQIKFFLLLFYYDSQLFMVKFVGSYQLPAGRLQIFCVGFDFAIFK